MLSPDDVAVTRALERGEIANEGFPHASHLRATWVYLHEAATLDEAVRHMADTLRRFVTAAGKAEKYSEATTVFWMLQVAAARAVMPGAGLDAVLRAYPRLLDKNLIRVQELPHVTTPGPPHSPGHAPDRPVPRRPA